MKPVDISLKEVQLRDQICFKNSFGQAYSTYTVYRIDDGVVYLFRPYIVTTDFSMVGNQVIHYIGTEDFKIEQDTSSVFMLLYRDLSPLR